MANLVYYKNEKIEFIEAFKRRMTINEAEIVFEKLCKHFKLHRTYQRVNLCWTSGSRCPKAFGTSAITLNVDCNDFGRLCHELAHIRERLKYGNTGHTRRHRRVMKTILTYCKKKNYWEQELKERLTEKPTKPELTKDELRLKVIERLEKNSKRYQTKVKMYQKKLDKAQKKIKRLKKLLDK
jgi:hypothetical protein